MGVFHVFQIVQIVENLISIYISHIYFKLKADDKKILQNCKTISFAKDFVNMFCIFDFIRMTV